MTTNADRLHAARLLAAKDGRDYASLTLAERAEYGRQTETPSKILILNELRETYDAILEKLGAERTDNAIARLASPIVADALALDYVARASRADNFSVLRDLLKF